MNLPLNCGMNLFIIEQNKPKKQLISVKEYLFASIYLQNIIKLKAKEWVIVVNPALRQSKMVFSQLKYNFKGQEIIKAKLKNSQQTMNGSSKQIKDNQQSLEYLSKWSLKDDEIKLFKRINYITSQILQHINPQKSILSKNKWKQFLQFQEQHFLTSKDRYELVKLIDRLLKIQFNRPFTKQQIEQQFLQNIDGYDISDEIGYKMKSLKHTIKERKKQALQCLQFMKEFNTFKTDFSDIKKIAKKVHQMCKVDMNAFCFITIYLINCTNRHLQHKPTQLFDIINKNKKIINQLSIIYPPSSVEKQQEYDNKNNELFQPIDVSYQYAINYPVIEFQTKNFQDKVQQIKKFIVKKAKQAKKDKLIFQNILKPICLERGSYYQSAVKIKSNKDEEILSIIRVLQKIIFKDHAEECMRELQLMKQDFVKELYLTRQFNKVGLFCDTWMESINRAQDKILKDKSSVLFNVGDMLRTKAMFKSRGDISKTVKDFQQIQRKYLKQKFSILQTEDRLETPTKDFKILFQIDDTIAQLQLCKQMNKQSNEFNHKIYELKRSKAFTPLFNLMILNQRLCEILFTHLLEFISQMIKVKEPQFVSGQIGFKTFMSDLLQKNVKAYKITTQNKHSQRLFTKNQNTLKQQTFNKLNKCLNQGTKIKITKKEINLESIMILILQNENHS